MPEFFLGQRYVADAEPELGLGMIAGIEGRTVTVLFPQSDTERCYAADNAPLTRIQFNEDDEIESLRGERGRVTAVRSENDLLFYQIENDSWIPETQVTAEIQLNQPFMRLLTGQLEHPRWFLFKREMHGAMTRVWQSGLSGFVGARAELIPHQLYVAQKACASPSVRILLADEVGLGKTVEAGLILKRLISTQRSAKALVAVPEALQVQWLVELVRRFALKPELAQDDAADYTLGNLHIVTHARLESHIEALQDAQFDTVIVDEAHHLTPGSPGFDALENLADEAEHVILLTATPEQLGRESHFARLQLLDRHKFNDFDQFTAMEAEYADLNSALKELPESAGALRDKLRLDKGYDADQIQEILLDSHGFGRVMFRNVRKAMAGFPSRVLHEHSLENDDWDEKFEFLARWLRARPDEKTLVICHNIDHVFHCEDYLWRKHGIDAATFHEQQSLIERDRAAAYFADLDEGSQVLICSEIGSEGRNFQFCSHLFCLDLPEHPDLLEQRIGRLDRIGQRGDVNIHTLSAPDSGDAQRLQWYHQVLECITGQNPAASAIHEDFYRQYLENPSDAAVQSEAHSAMQRLRAEIESGRDALLEMNSCRQPDADQLAAKISDFTEVTPLSLVETASELLQFHFEVLRPGVYSLIPSDNMLVPALPGIPPEGTELTFDREVAVQRDDLLYISWDSPFIEGLWDIVQSPDLGSATVACLVSRQLPAGHCLLECFFDVVVQAPRATQCRQFLPQTSVRSVVLDSSNKNLSAALPAESLENSVTSVKRQLAQKIVKSQKRDIPTWFKHCEHHAEEESQKIISEAQQNLERHYDHEIARLRQLKDRNPLIDEQDIEALRDEADTLRQALAEHTKPHLAAIRLIVITDR